MGSASFYMRMREILCLVIAVSDEGDCMSMLVDKDENA